MYLISLYFDEKTNNQINRYIRQVAAHSGNTYMLDQNVPPHITISAFESRQIELVRAALDNKITKLKKGNLQWVGVGQFFPYVLFLSPVLNEYLHSLSEMIYDVLKDMEGVTVSRYYRPFGWLPHTTIGKKLSKEEMEAGFKVLQNNFGMFEGRVVRIGLAKPSPYTEIADWNLE